MYIVYDIVYDMLYDVVYDILLKINMFNMLRHLLAFCSSGMPEQRQDSNV